MDSKQLTFSEAKVRALSVKPKITTIPKHPVWAYAFLPQALKHLCGIDGSKMLREAGLSAELWDGTRMCQ